MGFIQKDALRTMIINYLGLLLGYLNKGILFVLILSTEEIGLINLILSVGLLFAQLSNLGAINAIAKFLPFFRDNNEQKQSFFVLNLIFVFAGILIFSSLVVIIQGQIVNFYSVKSALFVDYYYWIIPVGIANVFFLVFEAYLRSLFKNILSVFVYEFLLRVVVTLLLTILAFDIINFNQFFILHALVYFLPSLILLLYLFKTNEIGFNRSTLRISKKFRKIIFSFSLFSYSNTIGALVVMTMDALMIAYFLGLSETGVYTTIIYLTSALQIPYKALFRVSSPLIPQYWKEKAMDKMEDLYQKVSSISLTISLFMFLLIWVSRNELFSYLPKEYADGVWVFLFLMVGRVFDMYSGLNSTILVTSKKYKYDILFTIILLVLVFSLNCWLIPLYGIIGAGISTGFALLGYNLCRMFFVLYAYKLHPFTWKQLKVGILFSALCFAFEMLTSLFSNPILEIAFNSILVSILFLGTIYFLNLEPEINNYIRNGTNFIKSKFKK
ncbi:MAG: polysaccharide biosynthesis C-terminal domain-containing protein [Bacteroidota bacterium]